MLVQRIVAKLCGNAHLYPVNGHLSAIDDLKFAS